MDIKDFSIEEAVQYGWNTMKASIWFFVGVLVVAWVIVGIPHVIANALQNHSNGLAFLFRIVGWVASIIVSIGMITIALKFLDKQTPKFEDLFSFQPHFWRYLGASILTGLVVWVGMILFIIPGIYWSIKFQFYGYFVIEQRCEPVEAMRRSSRITHTVKWKLLGFGIVLALINLLGAMCLFVGLFVTIPITLLAYSLVYRKLLEQTESAQLTPAAQ
ncbi:MAG: hypothetical protein JSU64_07460 [candidate division WOR-3 bacterium]|nr:MAG: hypothetical protein JSU64_07460 [candidate division WOR-3 bacterium]